jgi:hypothetical protein
MEEALDGLTVKCRYIGMSLQRMEDSFQDKYVLGLTAGSHSLFLYQDLKALLDGCVVLVLELSRSLEALNLAEAGRAMEKVTYSLVNALHFLLQLVHRGTARQDNFSQTRE